MARVTFHLEDLRIKDELEIDTFEFNVEYSFEELQLIIESYPKLFTALMEFIKAQQ